MKTSKLYSITLIFFIMLSACEKVDVPDPDGHPSEPIFYSEMNFGNAIFEAAAGIDNYLMDTEFQYDSSQMIIDLIGNLRPADCPGSPCRRSLRILLRDQQKPDQLLDINRMLNRRAFEYAWSLQRDSALVRFEPTAGTGDGTVYTWKVNEDKEIRNRERIEQVLKVDQDYRVLLKVNQQSCESSQLQTINLSKGGCRSVIRLQDQKAVVRSDGRAPFRYLWSTGSRDSVITLSPSSLNNVKGISVKVIDSNLCESEVFLGFSPGQGDFRYCETSFNYVRHAIPASDKVQAGKVMIEYTADDGVIYRSNGFRQPREATFEILEVIDFEKNTLGQKTKKIRAAINCLLSNREKPGEEIKFSGICVFAIAYPG